MLIFKKREPRFFFVFFWSFFAGEYGATNLKIKWVEFMGRRPGFLSRYGSCLNVRKKYFYWNDSSWITTLQHIKWHLNCTIPLPEFVHEVDGPHPSSVHLCERFSYFKNLKMIPGILKFWSNSLEKPGLICNVRHVVCVGFVTTCHSTMEWFWGWFLI